MNEFDLSHIENNKNNHAVIQSDEALFLYALVRGNRIKRILELGGGSLSYSAKNFLESQKIFNNSVVYSVDINPVNKISENHKIILKDCNDLVPSDVDNEPIDLIFFDCHAIAPQLNLYNILKKYNLITDNTIIVLHDTNLFYEPFINKPGVLGCSKESIMYDKVGEGFCHQWVERQMVNYFKLQGYDIFSIRTKIEDHDENFPLRAGLSICQKFKPMTPFYLVYEK